MKKVLAYIAIVTIVFSSFTFPSTGIVSAEGISDLNEKLDELKEDKENIEEKSGSISNETKETKDKIEENEQEQETVNNDIEAINADLEETQTKLANKENEINTTNQEITDKEVEIEETQAEIVQLETDIKDLLERIEEREKLLKNRLRSIQKNGGNVSYLEVLMGAQNFGDLINRVTAVTKIMDQDKSIMESHKADKSELETKKVAVEDKKVQLENDKASLEDKKATLVVQKEELNSLKTTLDSQMAEKETLMAELEREHNELEEYNMTLAEQQQTLKDQASIIAKAMKEAEAKKQELEQLAEEKNNSNTDSNSDSTPSVEGSSSLIWPTVGRHTSSYGYRSFNGGGMHYGLDIANSVGTPIKAAASGIVTRSNWSSSYGNVVYIYHPELNITTLYAHMSSRNVSYGQSVSQGDLIGGMGNTGRSFGSHLHFEVHNGGWSYKGGIDPRPYLP